ncbi:hypothetical protein PGT21_033328 [Puccinia graminis f. sp. tritici]|uniref:RING-type domain-containing protein n=1 Tax=Puccinia graminis f. sp. tritici TaxID=56615 RepID=A0A5B0RKX6_PUCGR|nr:hypothetical protein PGT21_033328 [Puccinia graminis f. sp. tritici]KAA1125593.1 hypothetical protein PGTUg99_003797 [Puccinia graminis f. sp. tritici]
MFLNTTIFLLLQAVYQSTARTSVDLAGKVDKLNQSSNPQGISASPSVISSSYTVPISRPNTLHRHSKRAKNKIVGSCQLCGGKVKEVQKSTIWPCDHLFHHKCVDKLILANKKDCPECPVKSVESSSEEKKPSISQSYHQAPQSRHATMPANLGGNGPPPGYGGHGYGLQPGYGGHGYGLQPGYGGHGYGPQPGYGGPPMHGASGHPQYGHGSYGPQPGYGGPPMHGPIPMYGAPGYPQSEGESYSGYWNFFGSQPKQRSLSSYPTYRGGPIPQGHEVVCYYEDEED